MIIHGERDLQVDRQDARLLRAAKPDAELRFIANANHVLKSVPSDDRTANLTTYADPDLPLAAGVVPAIAQFLRTYR